MPCALSIVNIPSKFFLPSFADGLSLASLTRFSQNLIFSDKSRQNHQMIMEAECLIIVTFESVVDQFFWILL